MKNEIQTKFVKIINYRGIECPQEKALNDCYKRFNSYYDWIAFYDVDEFLYIINYTNINTYLSLNMFKNCQCIIINWKYYGDNNNLYYKNNSLNERFSIPFYFNEKNLNKSLEYYFSAGKSIVRGGLNLIWEHLPHYFNNTKNCRPNGKILREYLSPPQYSDAYIKHYITKSTEEFIGRLKRGDVLLKSDENYIKKRIENYYFLFNKKTNEKWNLFKKAFNFIDY